MFLKEDQLAQIKTRFEQWKTTSELYPKRVKQIEEFVDIGRGIVWYAANSGKLTNEMLTALIQVLRANASWTVLDKYLPVIIPKEKRLAEVRGELSLTETRGFTGVGRNVIHGLNDEQLKAVKDLLEAAEAAGTEEEAMSLVKGFEAVTMRLVKSGIFSPWLYYLNPKLFPISNESHKGFRRKYGFPQPYSERMPGYWQLAKYLGADLGVLDAFIYSDESEERPMTDRTVGSWRDASWIKEVSRNHWEHFLDTCAQLVDRFDIEPEDTILGITPRTDSAKRISVNLANRLVLGIEHKQETLAIVMLAPDADERVKELADWGGFDSKPEAHLWTLPYDRFVELRDELMSECLTICKEYLQGKGSSSYRKHHLPDLYDMAVDSEFRRVALDSMLEGKGEWPGSDSEEVISSEEGSASAPSTRRYFKYSPGEQAHLIERCLEEGIAMVGHRETIGFDMTALKTRAEVYRAAGKEEDDKGNRVWNLWLIRDAKPGDVVFAAKGKNQCVGIGIIQGEYYFADGNEEYPHRREVKWLTNKAIDYRANQIANTKSLFRFDTFSPANAWRWILARYVELYPELAQLFDTHGLEYAPLPSNGPYRIPAVVNEPEVRYGSAYWWLNANPNIWSITDTALNGRQTYTSHNDKGNKRRVYKHFQEVKPGDLLVGYESSPSKQIKGVFKVIQGLHVPTGGQEQFEFELIEKFTEPIAYEEVIRLPELKECEPVVNNQGSLFKLTPEEFEVIRELIDSKQERVPKGVPRYDYTKDPDKPFLTAAAFDDLLKQLHRKKNLVLQGPPGVGKTFIARKLAYALMQEMDDSRIEMVQFHQSTSYEDFIQGLRPAKSGGFELRNGVFYTFCQRAQANPAKDFFFIIDEINRGNLSKILGELMLLIEADKRDKKYALKLTYSEDNTDTFWVPPNVHLIGTMNTADRSLAIVDYALRRRFAFVELEPDLGDQFRAFLLGHGLPDDLVQHLVTRLAEVNKHIKEDRDLGSGFQIGHSYFCGGRNGQDAQGWYRDVLAYEIRPLLQEIWFDNLDKARKMFEMLQR